VTFTPNKIDERIYQNGYISADEAAILKSMGITDILNLDLYYFRPERFMGLGLRIRHILVKDMFPMTDEMAMRVVREIHEALAPATSKLYVHCNAGTSRSPTAIWLYYLALGVSDEEASARIRSVADYLAAPDPVLVHKLDLGRIRGIYTDSSGPTLS